MFSLKNCAFVQVKTNRPATLQNGFTECGKRLFLQLGQRLLSISNRHVTANVEEDRKWTSKLKARTLPIYTYFALSTLRCSLVSVSLSFPDKFPAGNYFPYDPMSDLLHQMGILDRHMALLFIPVLPTLLYFDYLASFTRRLRCYLYYFDLLVINRCDFQALNQQVNTWRRLFLLLGSKADCIERQQKIRLKWQTLPHLGPLDHDIRVRSVALATVLDLLVAVVALQIAVIFLLTPCLLSLTTFWKNLSFIQKSSATADVSLGLYCMWHCITISLYEVHAINTLLDRRLADLLQQQQQQVNTSKGQILGNVEDRGEHFPFSTGRQIIRQPQPQLQHQLLSAFLSTAYLRRHRRLVDDLLTMNRQFISRLLFLGLLSLFGFTLYSFSLFTLRSRLKNSIHFLGSLLVLVIVFIGINPLIAATRLLHRPATELLYRSGQALSEVGCCEGKAHIDKVENRRGNSSHSVLHLKLKLSTYYEVLTSGEKFAFNAGPLGKITPNALFQVKPIA